MVAGAFCEYMLFRLKDRINEERKLLKINEEFIVICTTETTCFEGFIVRVGGITSFLNPQIMTARPEFSYINSVRSALQLKICFFSKLSFD